MIFSVEVNLKEGDLVEWDLPTDRIVAKEFREMRGTIIKIMKYKNKAKVCWVSSRGLKIQDEALDLLRVCE